MKKLLLPVLLILVAPATTYALGEAYNPINVQVTPDPFSEMVRNTQQQQYIDSLNRSLNQIQNSIQTQTAQQAKISQQLMYQQAAASCPPNSQPYVSKSTGAISGCYCIPPYSMQNGICVVSTQQGVSTNGAATYGNIKDSLGYWQIQCQLRKNAIWNSSSNTCDCLSGFSRSVAGGDCDVLHQDSAPQKIVATQRSCPANTTMHNDVCMTYEAVCDADYGVHSTWSGTFSDFGSVVCGCEDGYLSYGTAQTCNPIPVALRTQEHDAVAQNQTPASASSITGSAYLEESAHHGFWSWIRGLFGF